MSVMPGKQLAKHLVVISVDALSEDNWDYINQLPNFSYLINNGAYSSKMKSIMPTHTYVAHTTIVTGVYPNKHGIIHNHKFQPFIPESDKEWHWFQMDIQVPTIYDLAKKNKLKTAGILWPVTGKSSIKYNLPEIAAIKNENQALKVLRNGNPLYTLGLELRFGKCRRGVMQPFLDNYTTMCAIDTIKRIKPNLLLIHLIDLDDSKHNHGTKGKEVNEALIRMDKRIGDLVNAVKDSGIIDDTAFLIIGDHGQFDIEKMVYLNNLLKNKGLIYEENGIMKWRAYLQSTGGNAYLHIRDNDNEAEEIAISTLKEAMNEDIYGIEDIYDRAVLDSYNVHKSIRYIIEAKLGFAFDDELIEPIINDYKKMGKKYATHGYSPEKPNYNCIFIASGPGLKKQYSIGPINMVDLAPTMARILGLSFYECDGKVLEDIVF